MPDPIEIMARGMEDAPTWAGPYEWAHAAHKALSDAGFVLVPRVPTDEMREAGKDEHWTQDEVGGFRSDQAVAVYRAMIAAAQVTK